MHTFFNFLLLVLWNIIIVSWSFNLKEPVSKQEYFIIFPLFWTNVTFGIYLSKFSSCQPHSRRQLSSIITSKIDPYHMHISRKNVDSFNFLQTMTWLYSIMKSLNSTMHSLKGCKCPYMFHKLLNSKSLDTISGKRQHTTSNFQ